MVNRIKKFLVSSPAYKVLRFLKQHRELRTWEERGRPMPLPELMKHQVVRSYAKRFNLETFVETGTYLGNMIFAVSDVFHEIISIEVEDFLYRTAKRRFARCSKIRIVHGDSAEVLRSMLPSIDKTKRVLFWLDAHSCGGITMSAPKHPPVLRELECILDSQLSNFVVLIDDARMFTGRNGYPTMEQIALLVSSKRPSHKLHVQEDIVRIHIPDLS